MHVGDTVWAYLSRRQELVAVGSVRDVVQEGLKWFVLVDWDEARTAALGREPLPRSRFEQVPMSVCRAGRPAARVLDEYLDGGPEVTEDGRYIVVDGRRWRATDPGVPEKLRAELVAELMRARRLVRTREVQARPMVHDAKVALGERGDPWWEPTDDGRRDRLAATMRALLRHRDGGTICPSDAARVAGGQDWRELMPVAREVAARLAAETVVKVTRGGVEVDPAAPGGPIRLGPGERLTR